MSINELNSVSREELRKLLFTCCGSTGWVEAMLNRRPFSSEKDVFQAAETCWQNCGEADFLEAFTHHPKIGDLESLSRKFASTAHFAGGEQGSVAVAPIEILQGLANGNADYEQKFGFIFIVCATGKSAAEMLELLMERLPNRREEEVCIAAGEQAKITRIRLEKLLA
jgi:2-oxo-4-hydroxy-4-carboxy-5-ureidoimidazoline decarboxylase